MGNSRELQEVSDFSKRLILHSQTTEYFSRALAWRNLFLRFCQIWQKKNSASRDLGSFLHLCCGCQAEVLQDFISLFITQSERNSDLERCHDQLRTIFCANWNCLVDTAENRASKRAPSRKLAPKHELSWMPYEIGEGGRDHHSENAADLCMNLQLPLPRA